MQDFLFQIGGKLKRIKVFIITVILLGTGCSNFISTTPTLTPVIDTPTPPEIPTATVPPTSTSTRAASPLFEENIKSLVTASNFSVEVPFPLVSEVSKSGINISDEEGNFFAIFSLDDNEENQSVDTLLERYFAALEKRGFSFSKSSPVQFNLKELSGKRVDFLGAAQNIPIEGSAIAVPTNYETVLVGFGMSKLQQDPGAWQEKGVEYFNKLSSSITFFDNQAECPISTDQTYGYTPENPIKVGSGNFSGPSRERAYLNHLLDMKGNTIVYNRMGSTMNDATILDIYVISLPDGDVTLYVDEYDYSPPQAPVGFTCKGDFPFSAP